MATYVPVTVVASGGAPFVQVSGNAPPMTVVPNAAPITLVANNAPPVVLYNPDGSPYAGGVSWLSGALAKGYGFNAARLSYRANSNGIPVARRDAMMLALTGATPAARDFTFDAVALMSAFQSGGQAACDALATSQFNAKGLPILEDGFALCATTAVDPTSIRLDIQNPAGALYPRWMGAVVAMAKVLAPYGARVLFEPMNEFSTRTAISGAGYPDYYTVFCPAVFTAIRAVAPTLPLAMQSTDYGVSNYVKYFTASQFDANTLFAYHGYDPGEYSHQGQAGQSTFGINNLMWPVPDTAGGVAQAKADMEVRVNASSLTAPQKAAQIAANNATLDNLFTNGGIGTPAYPLGLLAEAETWRIAQGLAPRRLICTEFGAVSQFNSDNTIGTTTASRAAYERMWRVAIEAAGHHWLTYQAVGDFNHFEQTGLNTQSNRLIVELTEALGLRAPVPAAITDLAAGTTTVSTIPVSFTNVADATSYQYRLNGVAWFTLPTNKIITGLNAATSYTVEVRGKNATTEGPAASVSASTQTAPTAPAWVQAYGNPSMVAEFDNNRTWVSNSEGVSSDAATVARADNKFFDNVAGTWSAFATNVLARTSQGLSIEPVFSGPSSTPAKLPGSTFTANTTFPTGFQNFGAAANYTMAGIDETTRITNSGLLAIVPLGFVYEVSNTSGSTKFLQLQGGSISSISQVFSVFSRRVSGSGTLQWGKSSGGGSNKQPISTSETFTRYTFTDSGTGAVEISIPNNTVFQFVVAVHEYKAALPPSTPIVGSARAKDAVSLVTGAQNAINSASLIQADIGSGLTTVTAGALATMLDGGDVVLKKLVAFP